MQKALRGRPVPLSDAMVETAHRQLSECTSCAGGMLRHDQVSTALWRGDGLVVIEDVPALVCVRCGERYFEDRTAMALDMMKADKGPDNPPARILSVPVYIFAPPGGARAEEEAS